MSAIREEQATFRQRELYLPYSHFRPISQGGAKRFVDKPTADFAWKGEGRLNEDGALFRRSVTNLPRDQRRSLS